MKAINKEEIGWVLTHTWLGALEETARDFHGNRPRAFCERAYDHATEDYLRILENDYSIKAKQCHSIKEAIEEYIRVGVRSGLFQDASQFELIDINPNRLELVVHQCPYLKICLKLMDEGTSLKDLTCARIGCFRAAVQILSGIVCTYDVTEIHPTGCRGYIERR